MQPGWPFHGRTDGESIFFRVNPSPSACSGHFDQPPKGSAVQESPTSNILERGRNGKLNKGCTVHKGFNSDCMESRRKENFSEASAVHKGEFRNFFNVGVAKVHTLKQSATVKYFVRASVVIPVEPRQPGASSLVPACSVDPRGDAHSS